MMFDEHVLTIVTFLKIFKGVDVQNHIYIYINIFGKNFPDCTQVWLNHFT